MTNICNQSLINSIFQKFHFNLTHRLLAEWHFPVLIHLHGTVFLHFLKDERLILDSLQHCLKCFLFATYCLRAWSTLDYLMIGGRYINVYLIIINFKLKKIIIINKKLLQHNVNVYA